MSVAEAAPRRAAPTRAEAFRYWFRLGCMSFGGPAGQIALMHRELVDEKRWISERRFLHALNYCMVLPGPEAQQLATYIGWLMHRTWGGIVAGGLFVLPSLVVLIALSWLYMAYGNVPAVAGILYGVKPAVVAIVLHAAWRIGSRTLRHPVLWVIAARGVRRDRGVLRALPRHRPRRRRCWATSAGASRRRRSRLESAHAAAQRSARCRRSSTTTRPRPRTRASRGGAWPSCSSRSWRYGELALGALVAAMRDGIRRSRRWAGSSPRPRC